MRRMVALLADDFRLTLPVIQRGAPANEIRAYIKSSNLRAKVEIFSVKTNMRVHLHNDVDSEHYAETLLKIGDGCLDADAEGYILLSREFCNLVENDVDLITQVYTGLQQNLNWDQWLSARSIVAPNNGTLKF
ncbi:ATP-dependent DNA helicase [Trichonephila clavipes]|nr:ATP-dependent DNA helicase [Trichonephila clavipes]